MKWVLLAVILVVLTAVACLSFRGKGVTVKSVSSFTPNPMNDKIVIVKGWNEIEIQKIINDFIETYKSDGYPAYAIEPHKQEEHLFRLSFPKDIHPTLFTFLVNYVAYPFDLDFKNRYCHCWRQDNVERRIVRESIHPSLAREQFSIFPRMIRITMLYICKRNPESILRIHLLKLNGKELMMRGYRVK